MAYAHSSRLPSWEAPLMVATKRERLFLLLNNHVAFCWHAVSSASIVTVLTSDSQVPCMHK